MITAFTAARTGEGSLRLSWASDLPDPTFYLYRDGRLELSTTETTTVVAVDPADSPTFDVFDDPADAPTPACPDRLTLAWYATPATASYRIEQFDGGGWAAAGDVPDDGSGYYTWDTGRLADGVVHSFRVVPVGTNGNDGTPRQFSALVARVPDAPAVAMTYSAATGRVTIAALT